MQTKYVHLTEEQKQAANETDIASFLQSQGENIKRSGSEYEWVGHGITLRGNSFYDHYNQKGGGPVNFVQQHYNLLYPEAVQILLGSGAAFAPVTEYRQKEPKPFELPPKHHNMRRVYAYLIKQRCIDKGIVNHFANGNLLYEDAKYHNAVFIGTNKDGKPQHAHKKSTSIKDSSFRCNQEGSKAAFSFSYIGVSDTIFVFESPIDMLSFISIYQKDWKDHSYLALCSVADVALFSQLKGNPNIQRVALCLDNDQPGIKATKRIKEKLNELGYNEVAVLEPKLKDWNADLKSMNGIKDEPACEVIAVDRSVGTMTIQ